MIPRTRLPARLASFLLSCALVTAAPLGACDDAAAGADPDVSTDTAATDTAAATDATSSDAAPTTPLPGFVCEAGVMEQGAGSPSGECVSATTVPSGAQAATIEAACTDPDITALPDKRHLVVRPEGTPRGVLWVHFGGSGGKPINAKNLGAAAASQGYHFISLAYPNEPSVASRCSCPDGPRAPECEELVRLEVLYGTDHTDMFDMEADEAIIPRLTALLAFLADKQPDNGWGDFTDGDGSIVWSKVAVSGFSQGGGMAGLIARDHRVDRALYLSKGAGSATAAMIDATRIETCTESAECGAMGCCIGQADCDSPGPLGYCHFAVPALWADSGRDTDGDGVGDGAAATRATPAERQFAIVHRDEGAWLYSPEVFDLWGMGTRDDYVDADTASPPFGQAQLFSTALPPRGSCSEHQSMGVDSCEPRDDATGKPAMAPVWIHAMNATF